MCGGEVSAFEVEADEGVGDVEGRRGPGFGDVSVESFAVSEVFLTAVVEECCD